MATNFHKPKLSALMVNLLAGHANGKQVKEMAKDRYVSYSSATQTVAEAKKRLEARSLAHAIIRAQGLGFLSHPTGPDLFVFPLN
jgi:DNA-binding NarL/FixJ family response regulator